MADEKNGADRAEDGLGRTCAPGPRISSRVPTTIEGRAEIVPPAQRSAPNPPPESQVNPDAPETSLEAADAPLPTEQPHPSSPEGPVTDAPMPGEVQAAESEVASHGPAELSSPRRRAFGPLLVGALVVLLAAGALAWFFADGGNQLLASLRPAPETVTKPVQTPVVPAPSVKSPSSPSALTTPPRVDSPASPAPKPQSPPPAPSTPKPEVAPPAAPATEARKAEPPAPAAATALAPTNVASPANEPRFSDIDRRLGDLDAKIAALASAPAKSTPDTSAALSTQNARLGKIEETLDRLTKRLDGLDQKLTPKADTRAPEAPDVASTRATDNGAARIVVAQNLLAAVQSGASYAPQLAALRSLGAEDAGLARLAASADGVPTLTQLRDAFVVLRPKLQAQVKIDPDASWSDKVATRLSSLVSIRPVGERAGASPQAIATRADAALARGDVATALAELRMLPPGESSVAKDWISSATRRVEAEADARALVASSLASLAKPKS